MKEVERQKVPRTLQEFTLVLDWGGGQKSAVVEMLGISSSSATLRTHGYTLRTATARTVADTPERFLLPNHTGK